MHHLPLHRAWVRLQQQRRSSRSTHGTRPGMVLVRRQGASSGQHQAASTELDRRTASLVGHYRQQQERQENQDHDARFIEDGHLVQSAGHEQQADGPVPGSGQILRKEQQKEAFRAHDRGERGPWFGIRRLDRMVDWCTAW